jgi:potassium efflux system protein
MHRIIKIIPLIVLSIAVFSSFNGFAQSKNKKKLTIKREVERKALHSRDSLMRSLTKSDTSINSLLQRVEQYTTTFNQISNSLADGLDTADVSQQLPPVIKRIDKINTVAKTHKSSTLRYLFVLRDNLDRIQSELDGWQTDLEDVNTKLVQNETDLLKFYRDTILKTVPSDSLVRKTYFAQLKEVRLLWHKTDSTNRSALLKVNLLQDKIAISYTKTLDESDQIDSKVKGFALKAISGESDYIWDADLQYDNFKSALNSTLKLNGFLFNYFILNETETHLIGFLFLLLVFSWIIYNRTKALKNQDNPQQLFVEANYICKKPVVSSLLVVTAIAPYFYNHPPVVFLETFFLVSIILSFILISKELPKTIFNFLISLFVIAIFYSISNLFIEASNIDRFVILLLSVISIITGFVFYKKVKKEPDNHLPYSGLALKIFIGLQILSMLLNVTGRFSLAKIIGVTAVFNLWMLVILFLVVNIIIQGLFLQFQIKRGPNSFINWIDYNLVQKKFRNTLLLVASLLWLFFLLQNLNIEDWTVDSATDILNESRSIGGASFTFGGFVIFIFVIWVSSIASKLISYLYDISAQRVTDLSVAKKKNRTSALIIRMAVFSVGFLLAVAASGFPLDKLTIIISAFGVGIGFGLQNIVNNLVSGLILAFEKPINIGDVIQVDGHMGTMKEIGIRSSRVVTGDGSEVIIPNGDLISHQVVNWTLSNSNRQIELRIITAYGVDINKVKDILKDLLSNRDDIMSSPAPAVFLNNVDENAVEFKVLFWETDISTTSSLKSQVLTEIYQAIGKEGIPLPSTQKDIYLHFPEGIPLSNPEEKTSEGKTKKAESNKPKENPPGQVR